MLCLLYGVGDNDNNNKSIYIIYVFTMYYYHCKGPMIIMMIKINKIHYLTVRYVMLCYHIIFIIYVFIYS